MCKNCAPAKVVAEKVAVEVAESKFDKAEGVREFYRRQGEKREQERILTILEKLKNAPSCFELDLEKLINVIKGENK